jgi:hypothetical protein
MGICAVISDFTAVMGLHRYTMLELSRCKRRDRSERLVRRAQAVRCCSCRRCRVGPTDQSLCLDVLATEREDHLPMRFAGRRADHIASGAREVDV